MPQKPKSRRILISPLKERIVKERWVGDYYLIDIIPSADKGWSSIIEERIKENLEKVAGGHPLIIRVGDLQVALSEYNEAPDGHKLITISLSIPKKSKLKNKQLLKEAIALADYVSREKNQIVATFWNTRLDSALKFVNLLANEVL